MLKFEAPPTSVGINPVAKLACLSFDATRTFTLAEASAVFVIKQGVASCAVAAIFGFLAA